MKMGKIRMWLRIKLFVIFSVLMVLCVTTVSITIVKMTTNLYMKEVEATGKRDLMLITNSLESTLQRISNTAVSIVSDSRIIAAVKQYPNGPRTESEKAVLKNRLGLNIGTIIGASSDIFMWDVFSLSGDCFGISGYDFTRIYDQLEDEFFAEAASKLRMQVSGVCMYSYRSPSGSIPVFVVSKAIVDLDTRKPLGILLMMVRESRISSIFLDSVPDSSVTFTILDENDRIVSSLDKGSLGLKPVETMKLDEEQYDALRREGQLTLGGYAENTFYALSEKIDVGYVDWRVFMINPLTYANAAWRQTTFTVISFCGFMCVILFAASWMISRALSRPITRLVESVHEAACDDRLQPISDPGGSHEIEILYKSYNELLEHITHLIDHINHEQEEKSNYQFQLIQAQIKPHFLYNTLMTIKSLIDLDMNEMAGECVYAMSSFYRLSLNKGNDILRMGDELELSMQYMYIQKLRYIDRLDYIFDIPRNLYDYLIPKMTIQPILENAIYHGIKEKAGKGVVEVVGKDMGDSMEFTISDNGNGMTGQELERLRTSINAETGDIQPRNASFGLYSVNRRIQLLYGEQYGVHIDSRMGEYTIVTVTLPKISSFETENGGEA